MDFVKLNRRWVYSLTIEVFIRNFFTIVVIAIVNASIGIAQSFVGPFGFLFLPISLFFVAVTMIIAHKSVITGRAVPMNEAFVITSKFKSYYLQYFGISLLSFLILVVGTIAILTNYPPKFGAVASFSALFALAYASYFLLLSLLGTSLTSTAIGGDGMMMVTRGKLTFFYSLSRQLILPILLLAAVMAPVWFYFDQMPVDVVSAQLVSLGTTLMQSQTYIALLLLTLQIFGLVLTLISGVVLTKAFVLAELKMALKGEPSNWGAKAFGMQREAQEVRFA